MTVNNQALIRIDGFLNYCRVFFLRTKNANTTPTIIIGIRYKSISTAGGSSRPTGGVGGVWHKEVVVPAMLKNNDINIDLYGINVFTFFIIEIKIQFRILFFEFYCFY